jgi:hypothetical protein
MRLQDDLHRQLDVAAPHTPGQLASAGTLYMNAARVTAPSVAPRMCALLVEAMQGAHDAATTRPVPSLETLYVGGHCMRVLSRQFGAAEREPVVPEGVCESIQITGEPPRLLATHAQNESKASAVLQDLTRSGRINACATALSCIALLQCLSFLFKWAGGRSRGVPPGIEVLQYVDTRSQQVSFQLISRN